MPRGRRATTDENGTDTEGSTIQSVKNSLKYAAAEKERVPKRRDLAMEVIGDYVRGGGDATEGRFLVAINRASYS